MGRRPLDLTGGPLDGVRVTVTPTTARTGSLLIPYARGRYVDADGEWSWETDTTHRRPAPLST